MTETSPAENSARPAARPRKRVLILLALIVGLAAVGAYYWSARGQVSTDDAFVDGHIHQVTPRVAGYVASVHVEDNQMVEGGQLLAALDAADFETALAQAKADLAAAEAQLAALELAPPLELNQTASRVASAKAELQAQRRTLEQRRQDEEASRQAATQAEARLAQARLDLRRFQTLAGQRAAPQSDVEHAATEVRANEAELKAAQARAEAAARGRAAAEADVARLEAAVRLAATGQDQADIKAREAKAQRARVDLAQARLRQAELNLTYARITAPVRGQVAKKRVEPGQYVEPGQPLLAVVPLDPRELWVTANLKETQLAGVRPGLKVRLEVDAYPDRPLTGVVDSIMAGTGAIFSLFPPENASGNYVKVVQRTPVRIRLEPNERTPPLRLGLSVVPTIFLDEGLADGDAARP